MACLIKRKQIITAANMIIIDKYLRNGCLPLARLRMVWRLAELKVTSISSKAMFLAVSNFTACLQNGQAIAV
jgi:hypothetical protein